MDSIRYIGLSIKDKEEALNWITQAAVIQKQYYEQDRWQNIKGKREILEMELQEAFYIGNSSDEMSGDYSFNKRTVGMIMDVICKQVYDLSEYKFKLIMPLGRCNGNIRYPIFAVSSRKRSFIIDQDAKVYSNLLCFHVKNKFKELHFSSKPKTLKVHDFQALLSEIKCVFNQSDWSEEGWNSLITHSEEDVATKLSNQIYKNLGLTDDFAVRRLFCIGRSSENCRHFPVIQVSCLNPVKLFYVDHIGRVYKNWKDFLKHNVYPKGLVCYPRDGTYQTNVQGKVFLDVAYSPKCGIWEQSLPYLDGGGTVVSIGAAAFGTGIFGAVALGLSGACVIVAGSDHLIDRWKHNQSMWNLEALPGWMNVVGGMWTIGRGATMAASKVLVLEQALQKEKIFHKSVNFISSAFNSLQGGVTVANEISQMVANRDLKGIKITKEDVKSIFNFIPKQFIKLNNVIIECTEEVKMHLVKLWHKYFTRREYSETAASISMFISQSQKIENPQKPCETNSDFYSILEFVLAHKARVLNDKFLTEIEQEKKILRDNFDEARFHDKWDAIEREHLSCVDEISDKTKELYSEYSEKISILNGSGDIKFQSDIVAIKYCFCSCLCDEYKLTPDDYFAIIRRVAADDKLNVVCEEHGDVQHIIYFDETVPVMVTVNIICGKKFFIDTHFGN